MDDLAADDCERSAAGERAARERRVAAFREEPCGMHGPARGDVQHDDVGGRDRKSTRLNSSHSQISYAVFCLKKKKYHTCSSTDLSSVIVNRQASCSVR